MAKVRPLSMKEILLMVRRRPMVGRHGRSYRGLYLILDSELKAMASAFYRASRRKTRRADGRNKIQQEKQ